MIKDSADKSGERKSNHSLNKIKLRRFRADYTFDESETGIGIVEYSGGLIRNNWENYVIGITSIYIDENISNRDASIAIFQHIYNQLEDDERAILQMNRFSQTKTWHLAFKNKINFYHIERQRGRIFHAQLLADDAIRRKTNIIERFDDPVKFSILEMEREERERKA